MPPPAPNDLTPLPEDLSRTADLLLDAIPALSDPFDDSARALEEDPFEANERSEPGDPFEEAIRDLWLGPGPSDR